MALYQQTNWGNFRSIFALSMFKYGMCPVVAPSNLHCAAVRSDCSAHRQTYLCVRATCVRRAFCHFVPASKNITFWNIKCRYYCSIWQASAYLVTLWPITSQDNGKKINKKTLRQVLGMQLLPIIIWMILRIVSSYRWRYWKKLRLKK